MFVYVCVHGGVRGWGRGAFHFPVVTDRRTCGRGGGGGGGGGVMVDQYLYR